MKAVLLLSLVSSALLAKEYRMEEVVSKMSREQASEESSPSGRRLAAARGGTDIGGGTGSSEFVMDWCRSKYSTLKRYQDQSRLKLSTTSDYLEANRILVKGMLAALNGSQSNTTFIYRSLLRGIEIAERLHVKDPNNTERSNQVNNYILDSYYKFMINEVASRLDIEVYVPYLSAIERKADFDVTEFEKRFINFAKEQLSWLNTSLSTTTKLGNSMIRIPTGDSRDYLEIAEVLTAETAKDLRSSLWSAQFECAAQALEYASQEVAEYNRGNREIYPDDRIAVFSVGQKVEEVITQINNKQTCHN